MAKTQYCRNKNYNSVNYTTKMLLEDWDQGPLPLLGAHTRGRKRQ